MFFPLGVHCSKRFLQHLVISLDLARSKVDSAQQRLVIRVLDWVSMLMPPLVPCGMLAFHLRIVTGSPPPHTHTGCQRLSPSFSDFVLPYTMSLLFLWVALYHVGEGQMLLTAFRFGFHLHTALLLIEELRVALPLSSESNLHGVSSSHLGCLSCGHHVWAQ